MFGCRTLCIESAFFSTYRHQALNRTTNLWHNKTIEPIIPPQFRLLVYLAPAIISLLVNAIRLALTTKGLRKHYMKYPQFIVASCFTPFMFEGHMLPNSQYHIKIWKLGTFINALYIGCLPQCVLLVTVYYKGVPSWDFIGIQVAGQSVYQANDALFKTPYGNTIFAITSSLFFFLLIVLFFNTEMLFKRRGIHCICMHILCCPCPSPCIHYTDPSLNTPAIEVISPVDSEMNGESLNEVGAANESNSNGQSHTEIYCYTQKGERKKWLVGQKAKPKESIPLQVIIIIC